MYVTMKLVFESKIVQQEKYLRQRKKSLNKVQYIKTSLTNTVVFLVFLIKYINKKISHTKHLGGNIYTFKIYT